MTGFGNDHRGPKLILQLRVDDSEPLFQGNKTKLHVNLTHDFNSSSAAFQVTLLIEVSFKGELSSCIVTPESKNPDVLQGSNIEFNRLPLQDVFLGQCDLSVGPDRLTEPGHLHVGHVIATLSYSGDQDNYTDLNTGERIEKIIKNTYTSFYFYVLDASCVQPLGMRSGGIKESHLLSSSCYKETHSALGRSPHRARFGGASYWSPVGGSASINSEQFLQIAFETPIQLKMVCLKSLFNGKYEIDMLSIQLDPTLKKGTTLTLL